MASCFRDLGGTVGLSIRALPRSSREGPLAILADGSLKWGIKAAPVEGQANSELIRAVARFLGVRKGDIDLRTGQTGRNKLLVITGISLEQAQEKLSEALAAHGK